jgi:hypothetical protein
VLVLALWLQLATVDAACSLGSPPWNRVQLSWHSLKATAGMQLTWPVLLAGWQLGAVTAAAWACRPRTDMPWGWAPPYSSCLSQDGLTWFHVSMACTYCAVVGWSS